MQKFYCFIFQQLILVLLVPVQFKIANGAGVCETMNCRHFQANRLKKQEERIHVMDSLRENFAGANNAYDWIGKLSFKDLVAQLQTRKISAVAVLSAFIGRSINATDEFNCVTEFVPEAMKWAMELDRLPTVKGPLHGVPFCVKDDHQIEGMDTTMGFSRNLFKPAKATATIIKIYRDLGAIPCCKTNLPQSLLVIGSDNPIFGPTLNPLNKNLSPGGSSSGSGCIVGAGAIPFATGTDLGGSGRLPAHFNGISSIVPTSRRLSVEGITSSSPKLVGLSPSPAIFAKKPSTLVAIFKALTENSIQNLYDPQTVPLSWNAKLFEEKRPLRFGYVKSMPFFPTLGDTPLVIEDTKRRLEVLGHTGIPVELPDGSKIMKTFLDILFADKGDYFLSQIKDDEISSSVQALNLGLKSRPWLKKLSSLLPVSGKPEIILKISLDAESSSGLQEAVDVAKQMSKHILQTMHENQLDFLVTPIFPVPAVRLNDPRNLFLAICYVTLWNLVDFPTGVIPMGTETGRNVDATDTKGDIFVNLAKASLKASIGMPIGVQIIAKPFKEELILRTMVELEGTAVAL